MTTGWPAANTAERKANRRALLLALVRSGTVVVLLVVAYFLAPLDQELSAKVWIEFGLGLVVFGVVIAWQVRGILNSKRPRLRAIEALAVGLPLLLLLFASAYVLIQRNTPHSFTETITRMDSLYFTVTVFTTVGFGDIAAKSETARIIVTIQMLTGVIVIGLVAKIVLGAVQVAVQRQTDQPDQAPEDPTTPR